MARRFRQFRGFGNRSSEHLTGRSEREHVVTLTGVSKYKANTLGYTSLCEVGSSRNTLCRVIKRTSSTVKGRKNMIPRRTSDTARKVETYMTQKMDKARPQNPSNSHGAFRKRAQGDSNRGFKYKANSSGYTDLCELGLLAEHPLPCGQEDQLNSQGRKNIISRRTSDTAKKVEKYMTRKMDKARPPKPFKLYEPN